MREGSLVVVLGKIDERIYEHDGSLVIGTLWFLDSDQAVVILSNGNLWKGPRREVSLAEEQSAESAPTQSQDDDENDCE